MKDTILSPRVCYRINFIGDHKSGKTTIIKNNLDLNFIVDITTNPNLYCKNYQNENTLYNFLIMDTPGHYCLKNITEMYYNNYDSLVIVIDILNERSFDQLPYLINRIEEVNKEYNNIDKTIFIVANFKKKQEFDDKKLLDFSLRYNFYYLKYYTDDNHLIYQIFETIIKHKKNGKPKPSLIYCSNIDKQCNCNVM